MEAALKHKEEYSFFTKETQHQKRLSFICGAKWQKEQDSKVMYTEEEIKDYLHKLYLGLGLAETTAPSYTIFEEWFDKHKK